MPDKLNHQDILSNLDRLHQDWTLNEEKQEIKRIFKFRNYHECMAFVNAIAWIAHQQDHHPDLLVTYNRCQVVYSTHSAGGITALDFNAAHEADRLLNAE